MFNVTVFETDATIYWTTLAAWGPPAHLSGKEKPISHLVITAD